MNNSPDRASFLAMAALFEGGLLVVALAAGWLFGAAPLESFRWDWAAVLWGLAGVAPLYAGFLAAERYPVGPLQRIKDLLDDLLGPVFSKCSRADLAVVAVLAGLGEETLFRGLLLPLTGFGSFTLGLIISSVLFGLAHAVTPTYVVLATLAGVFFGLQWHFADNLLAPIISHAVYDYLAFAKIARDYRAARAKTAAANEAADADEG